MFNGHNEAQKGAKQNLLFSCLFVPFCGNSFRQSKIIAPIWKSALPGKIPGLKRRAGALCSAREREVASLPAVRVPGDLRREPLAGIISTGLQRGVRADVLRGRFLSEPAALQNQRPKRPFAFKFGGLEPAAPCLASGL